MALSHDLVCCGFWGLKLPIESETCQSRVPLTKQSKEFLNAYFGHGQILGSFDFVAFWFQPAAVTISTISLN